MARKSRKRISLGSRRLRKPARYRPTPSRWPWAHAAGVFLMLHRDWRLAHGVAGGRAYAWCERGRWVSDPFRGTVLPKSLFYKMYRVDRKLVSLYSFPEARAALDRHKRWFKWAIEKSQ